MDENVYGHKKRLDWIRSYLKPSDRILEIGCGTGVMITLPLAESCYDIKGFDEDSSSIEYGQKVLTSSGLDSNILKQDLKGVDSRSFDVIIASEVVEHIDDDDMGAFFDNVQHYLKPGGLLLVTVPNGYGCFEIENAIWSQFGLGRLLSYLYIDRAVLELKQVLGFKNLIYPHPSTLSASPHLQYFTVKSICRLIETSEFEVLQSAGSTLMSGPITNLLFGGLPVFFRINNFLGKRLKYMASGIYIAAQSNKAR